MNWLMIPKIFLPFVFLWSLTLLIACSHSARTETATAPSVPASNQVQSVELIVGENGAYTWHGRSWQAGELQSALPFESKKVRIEEIRLLNGSGSSTMQNVIEIGQLAKAIGAKALYQRNGEFKSIVIVE